MSYLVINLAYFWKNNKKAGARKDEYVIKDTKVFATYRRALVLMGFIDDGSFISKIRKPIFVFLLFSAPIHHTIPVFLDETINLDEVLMCLYMLMMYILVGGSWSFMITRSSDILKLWKMVRKGFYHYSDTLTRKERMILSKTDDLVIKTMQMLIGYVCVCITTFLKEMSPESLRNYKAPYPGWFPWTINSNFRFSMALFYHLCLCINTTFSFVAILFLFLYHMIHFECQLRLLTQHFKDTFPPGLPASVTYGAEHKKKTLRRLKECVRHHLVIKGFHEHILSYFGICLLVFRVIVTIMMCILCYSVTTGISLNNIIQLFSFAVGLQILCFIFCLKGEQVTQLSDEWRQTVYEVDWWNHPVEVQKTIYMMQMGASRPMMIYGIWKPAMYSHEGISVIGQETYSFFNMLRAVK